MDFRHARGVECKALRTESIKRTRSVIFENWTGDGGEGCSAPPEFGFSSRPTEISLLIALAEVIRLLKNLCSV